MGKRVIHATSEGSRRQSSVSPGFVKGMLAGLRPHGVDPAPILRATGVSAETSEGRGARVPVGQYAALYNAVVHALGDEAFGLLSAPMRPGSFEFLCRSVVGSATLGEALDRTARFLAL